MKNYKKIIKNIEKVRTKNNQHWMKLLSIAFNNAPKESSKVLKDINRNDMQISKLFKKLSGISKK